MSVEMDTVNQIALSATDKFAARQWYCDILGFVPSGGAEIAPADPGEATQLGAIQGMPGADADMCWAVDRQDFFQLEFFQYRRPEPKPAVDRRPCDIGYAMASFHVDDFDATRAKLAGAGNLPLSQPIGAPGSRRVCVRDPMRTLIELWEDDLRPGASAPVRRPEIGVAARSVTVSVPDLGRARRFFVDALGLAPAQAGVKLHGPEHEALWGLEGSRRETLLLSLGQMWIEVVQYQDPVGEPWPGGYLIADIGIVNIALGTRDEGAFVATLDRVLEKGHRSTVTLRQEGWASTYVEDEDGFSVELFYITRPTDATAGFEPSTEMASLDANLDGPASA